MSTEHFVELTTELIKTVGEAYEQLVAAYDPDDVMAMADELVESVKYHIEKLEREYEFPSEERGDGGEFE